MKKKNNSNKIIISFINKILFCTILFLVAAIISKTNPTYKEKIKNYLYNQNFNFSTIRNIYNKYLGGISPIKKDETVFNEKIKYNNISSYKDGAKLEVEKNYLVPNQEKGIVV